MIISTHIPRTAGTSFGKFVARVHPPTGIDVSTIMDTPYLQSADSPWYTDKEGFLRQWRESKKWENIPANVQFLHFNAPAEMFDGILPDATRVVWMRHPVSLIVSQYYFAKQIDPAFKDMSIDEYIELPWRQNWQTLYTGGDLNRFDFVGITECFAEDLAAFTVMMGWDLSLLADIPRINVGRFTSLEVYAKALQDADLVDRIFYRNKDDLGLYEEALCLRTYDITRTGGY